jgi:hypothetical protein
MNAASLEHLQASVERHFEKLAAGRRSSGLPIFALEHGLSKAEVNDLSLGLRRHIAFGGRLSQLWLLWVVYATELGYDFDGEEYWQSYQSRTPQWTEDPHRRQYLRQFFERFESKFGGAIPTGQWARQFSIIAWPITHAVLPRDLQSQMARALFELRHEMAEATTQSAFVLGGLIARHAEGASSRFRNFLEHEELAGRIARALLLPEGSEFDEILTPATLARIVADLEASWESKSWLKEARDVVQQVRIRLHFKRLGDGANAKPQESREGREVAEAKCVTPVLSLRRMPDGPWQGFIEIPSFSGWARTSPNLEAFLQRSRCKIRGTEDVWRNRRWLLFGAQAQRVLEWPSTGTSWIRFEERGDETVPRIDEEFRVKPKPWIFRIDDDDRAYQTNWASVKPGARYVIVHNGELASNEYLVPADIDVKGSVSHVLEVPAQATEASTRCLGQLGLSVARTLKVWPAGLPSLGFGDNDVLEWSAHLPLTLGVEHDDTCDAFTLLLDGKGTTFKTSGRRSSLVALGEIAPGVHQISVAVSYRAANGTAKLRTQASQRAFTLAVRQPVGGFSSRRQGHVLVATPDPQSPSMDSLMNGLATCSVHGPYGRKVDFQLELLNGSGEVIHCEALGSLDLPVDQAAWRQLVEGRDGSDSVGEAYFRASSGRLVIDGRDLGKAALPLKHSISPVRWHVSRAQRQVWLNLVDDTDHAEPVRTYHACFNQPALPSEPWDSMQTSSIRVADGGGLYVATVNGHRSSIVVSAPPSRMSLDDWRHSTPTLQPYLTSGQQVAQLLFWIRDWTDARLIGPFAERQRSSVLREMHRQLYASICDPLWVQAELNFKDSRGIQEDREALESAVWQSNPAFAIGLARHAEAVVTNSLDETCIHLLDHVGPYSVCNDRRLCEIALRIGMAPQSFAAWAGVDTSARIDAIVDEKVLLKAVRLLALLLGTRGQLLARDW